MVLNKPLVSIVMAIYNPNMDWLNEQLKSINEQDYQNLEFIALDDCSSTIAFGDIYECIKNNIKNIHFRFERNNINIGSNKTFEKLTLMAEGQYIAYCDQDDIWEYNKISQLYQLMNKKNSVLAYSDMKVIDEVGNLKYESLKKERPRLKYVEGAHLTSSYVFANCTAGCCMMVCSDVAKKAIPFLEDTVCDQWLCVIASVYGSIAFSSETLVKYRIHGENQTGILYDVKTKQDYYTKRILPMVNRVEALIQLGVDFKQKAQVIRFAKARKEKRIFEIWKDRRLNQKDAYFEIAMKFIPNRMFIRLIEKIRR